MTQQEQGRSGTGSLQAEASRLAGDAEARAREAQDQARGLAGQARGAAQDVADEARQAGGSLRQAAGGMVDALREGVVSQAQAQKDAVADRIDAIAERVHSTADELRDREGWLADILDRGAREIDTFADAAPRRDVRELAGSLQDFARRQPALFVGAAVAAGFALTRVARASMERQSYGQGYGGQGGYGGRPAGGRA